MEKSFQNCVNTFGDFPILSLMALEFIMVFMTWQMKFMQVHAGNMITIWRCLQKMKMEFRVLGNEQILKVKLDKFKN